MQLNFLALLLSNRYFRIVELSENGMARKPKPDGQAALEQAQELMCDAWETPSAKRQIALAKKALAISPLCADAFVMLAKHAEFGSDELLDLWRRGVEAGKQALGDEFEYLVGEFWGFLETRPYMRALCGLAVELRARGALDESIEHMTGMLRLNPQDNLGMRYLLAPVLLEAGRDEQLVELLNRYPGDDAAAWLWTAALVAFRRLGDCPESKAALSLAFNNNPRAPAYLLGTKRLPKINPPYYSPGDGNEAIMYARQGRGGWAGTPGALDWLQANTLPFKMIGATKSRVQ